MIIRTKPGAESKKGSAAEGLQELKSAFLKSREQTERLERVIRLCETARAASDRRALGYTALNDTLAAIDYRGGRPMMPERGGSKGFRALRIRFAMRPFRLGSLSAWAASQMLIRPALLLCRVPPWPMNSCSPSMCSSIRRPRITTE